MHTYTHTYIYIYICTYTCAYIIYIYIYDTYINTHIYICIYIHKQIQGSVGKYARSLANYTDTIRILDSTFDSPYLLTTWNLQINFQFLDLLEMSLAMFFGKHMKTKLPQPWDISKQMYHENALYGTENHQEGPQRVSYEGCKLAIHF